MKTLKNLIVALVVLASFTAVSAPAVLAGTGTNCAGASENSTQCNGGPSGNTNTPVNVSLKNNPIVKDLNIIVNFLSAAVGIVVVAMLITGGIQYSMAGGSPEGVGKAKTRITNAFIALALYLLIFGFLQWIVPGGLFS